MRQRHPLLTKSLAILTCLTFLAVFFTATKTVAAVIEDGVYALDYTVRQVDRDSVSIANDYFQKPATLTVNKGKQHIELVVNHSEWVKAIQVINGDSSADVTVIQEDLANDSRTIRFEAKNDLAQGVLVRMHVQITAMDPVYDHTYTVRYDFDVASMEHISTLPVSETNSSQSYFVYAIIAFIILLIGVTIAVRLRKTKKSTPN